MRTPWLVVIPLLVVTSCTNHNSSGCDFFEKFDPDLVNSNFTIVEINQQAPKETEILLYSWAEFIGDTIKRPLALIALFQNNKLLLQSSYSDPEVLLEFKEGALNRNDTFSIKEGITQISLDEIIYDKRTREEIWRIRFSNFIYHPPGFGRGDAVILANFCRGVIAGYHSEKVNFEGKNKELVCRPTGDISSLDFSRSDLIYGTCNLY